MPRFTRCIVRVAIALCVAWTVGAPAQTRFGLSPAAFAVYQRWVLSTCVGEDAASFAADLRRHAGELVPALQRALAEGPTADESAAVRAAAESIYARRAKFSFDDHEVTGVSAADIARFRETSGEAFVADQLRRFETGYRANAVGALGIIGTPPARATLQRIARTPRDPLAPAARAALALANRSR